MRRTLLPLVVLLVFVPSFLLACGSTFVSDITGDHVESHDYISYWAAGKLLLHHHDPYNAQAILSMEGRSSKAMVMRNPPWSLWLTLPLGLVSAVNGSRLWHLLLIAALALSMYCLRGKREDYLAAFLFGPTIYCIAYGQTSLFVLLGVCGFLFLRDRSPFLAGAALSLCALKPHLLLPFFAVVIIWTFTQRRYALIAGLATSLVGEVALARWFDPGIWSHYRYTMQSSGIDAEFLPTFSGALRYLVHGPLWMQFAPTAIVTGWAAFYYLNHRETWDWSRHGSIVLVLSVFFAPYAWLADLALLWPALMPCFRGKRMQVMMLFVSGAMLLQLCCGVAAHSMLALWPPLAWLALFVYGHQPMKGYEPPPAAGAAIMMANA
jgi:hypothetical protein